MIHTLLMLKFDVLREPVRPVAWLADSCELKQIVKNVRFVRSNCRQGAKHRQHPSALYLVCNDNQREEFKAQHYAILYESKQSYMNP